MIGWLFPKKYILPKKTMHKTAKIFLKDFSKIISKNKLKRNITAGILLPLIITPKNDKKRKN